MIDELAVEHFGCLTKVEAKLTKLHAFIGPNDSGKSTLLRAVRLMSRAAHGDTRPAILTQLEPSVSLRAVVAAASLTVTRVPVDGGGLGLDWEPRTDEARLRSAVGPAVFLRLSAEALRASSGLVPDGQQPRFLDERGTGLAGICLDLIARRDGSFDAIEKLTRERFPTMAKLEVPALDAQHVALRGVLDDGRRVPAEALSDGILYFLAFAVLPYVARAEILLLEEPENGLHPVRVRDVVGMIRDFVTRTGTQVLMATHSPLVVNELGPDEVTVVTRTPAEGTRLRSIREVPDFERRAAVYSLGELWLSYADGDQEAPLFDPAEP